MRFANFVVIDLFWTVVEIASRSMKVNFGPWSGSIGASDGTHRFPIENTIHSITINEKNWKIELKISIRPIAFSSMQKQRKYRIYMRRASKTYRSLTNLLYLLRKQQQHIKTTVRYKIWCFLYSFSIQITIVPQRKRWLKNCVQWSHMRERDTLRTILS